MSKYEEMIAQMKTMDYGDKKQLLEYLVRMAESAKQQFSQEDKDVLLTFAYGEMDNLLRAIPEAATYRKKEELFLCEDHLLGIIMHLCASPTQIPQDVLMKIKALVELVDKERYIEKTVDSVFEKSTITKADITRLLYWARQTGDEYQKSQLFLGLVHYQKNIYKMDRDARSLMADYIAQEMQRLVALNSEEARNTLEVLADVSKFFVHEKVIAALQDVVQLGYNHINVYALDALYTMGEEVPQTVIEALAHDLQYANMAYQALRKRGKAALFPAPCATEEYLAKSDMVHWLTYPTELGKAPDEIVYIGKIKKLFKKEVYHVFKYRSDSDTLQDELKNKWLIGWSSEEGGTFSNFDEFAPFEQGTVEKTLKLIQKKLIE